MLELTTTTYRKLPEEPEWTCEEDALFVADYRLCFHAPFQRLAVSHLPLAVLRPAWRSLAFLSGDFVRSGLRIANRKWAVEKRLCHLKSTSMSPWRFSLLASGHILFEGAKNITKIVFYPLASLFLFSLASSAALAKRYILTFENRKSVGKFIDVALTLHGKIELCLARHWEFMDPPIPRCPMHFKLKNYDAWLFTISEISALCQLSTAVMKNTISIA